MTATKLSPAEWAEYLTPYYALEKSIRDKPWFANGWQTACGLLNKESPRGVWFRLIKGHWFDGALHFETWITNADVGRKTVPLVLHVETSKEKHGINRNEFTKLLLSRCTDTIQTWPGYVVKPSYPAEPFSVQLAFTKDSLASTLEVELERLQLLGPEIDRAILETTVK